SLRLRDRLRRLGLDLGRQGAAVDPVTGGYCFGGAGGGEGGGALPPCARITVSTVVLSALTLGRSLPLSITDWIIVLPWWRGGALASRTDSSWWRTLGSSI